MTKKPPVDLSDKQHSQLFLNDDYLGEGDFVGKDGNYREFKLKIRQVTSEELQLPGRSKKEDKIVLSFDGAKKRLVLNKTNSAAIKSHHGKHVSDWLNKFVTVFYNPSVKFGRETVGGVRIRSKS